MATLRGALNRVGSRLAVAELRRAGIDIGAGARLLGTPLVTLASGSRMRLGERFLGISRSCDTALGVAHAIVLRTLREGALLEIGDDVGMSGGSICSALRVSIGDGCLLGADVTVLDTDFHPAHHAHRRYAALPPPEPEDAVIIESNVFVGTRAIILRGSRIGKDAVIGAGAVVKGVVEPGSLVGGNPARLIRPRFDVQQEHWVR